MTAVLMSMLFGLGSLWCFGLGLVVTFRWIARRVQARFPEPVRAAAPGKAARAHRGAVRVSGGRVSGVEGVDDGGEAESVA